MGTYATSERTKLALVHAAGELVAERGLGRVSTRAIAFRANENLGSIHYHFGSKEELFKEMLRFACHTTSAPLLPEVLEHFHDRLGDVRSQSQAVRAIVEHLMRETFSPERPRWCSRVLYHVAQHSGPFRSFLREQVFDPFLDAVTGVVRRIRPEWTREEVQIWVYALLGPIVFHADHGEIIRERLRCESFPADYLARLEQRLLDDAARALGLPSEAA